MMAKAATSKLYNVARVPLIAARQNTLLAAAMAVQLYDSRTAVAELAYQRSTVKILIKAENAAKEEHIQYLELLSRLAGTKLTADASQKDQISRGRSAYEESTGMKLESPEMAAAIEATIAGMG